MRSLTESQWERYFELVEHLEHVPADRRRDFLRSLRSQVDTPDIVSLAEKRFGLTPEPDRCRTGERLRNFVLGECIGSGGMGVIYRAVQVFSSGIEREVALKLIHPGLLLREPEAALQRFHHEINSLVKLEHRGIARIYDGGISHELQSHEDTPFFAMELVHGKSLTAYVTEHRQELGIRGTLRLFLRVCDAVAYAHQHGVIHCDLKPANILVDGNGEPRIIDFGLAQVCDTSMTHHRVQYLSGTPAYMSPEQITGEYGPLTPASDVYTLGVILYELLAGQRPYQVRSDASPAVIAETILHSTPENLRRVCPECGSELAQTVAKALAKTPAARHSSVSGLQKDLRRCLKVAETRQQRLRRSRQFLHKKVQDFWIDGVLRHSLHHMVRIELGFELRTDAVERPWDLIVQMPDQPPPSLPPGKQIDDIFREFGNTMLILGAPGAGKTTLLLELARDLLHRAQQDASQPLPLLFHLSTWAEQRLPLMEWVVDELDKRYDLPPGAARAYLAHDRVVLLLDGLDEVAPVHRAPCVAAINAFRKRYEAIPLAVCSRLADYEALSVRLHLAGAVVIQPLTRQHVDAYLVYAGEPLVGVRTALQADETLWELLQTPLLLSIAALAYQGCPAQGLHAPGTLEERRTQLFARYTDAMFARRSKTTPYTSGQTLRWLAWLAVTLRRHNHSVFYLEWMQPDWLPTRLQQWLVSVGSVMICGLAVGLMVGVFGGHQTGLAFSLTISLMCGLGGGLVCGLLGYGDTIRPITRLRLSWRVLSDGLGRKLAVALGIGALMSGGIALVWDWGVGGAVGVIVWVAFVLFGMLDVEVLQTDVGRRTVPNEGMHHSLRHAGIGALVGGGLGGLIGGVTSGPLGGLFGGCVFGLILFMLIGAHTCLQHLLLRLLLWQYGVAPWNYVRFLEYAVERIFLYRVGGGYMFVHRSLLEYFAEQSSASSPR